MLSGTRENKKVGLTGLGVQLTLGNVSSKVSFRCQEPTSPFGPFNSSMRLEQILCKLRAGAGPPSVSMEKLGGQLKPSFPRIRQ